MTPRSFSNHLTQKRAIRYKDLLDDRDQLKQWYDFENARLKPISLTVVFAMLLGWAIGFTGPLQADTPDPQSPFGTAQRVGQLQDSRLVECSGLDASLQTDNLLWAINDGGHGPYIYALRHDGRSMGRVQIIGARNRDWEGLDTFMWQNRPMILIADFGDNDEKYASHILYVVEEPACDDNGFSGTAAVEVAWRIKFSYPDRRHDAEGVAVDAAGGKILIMTKRDDPPLLYALPLNPQKEHVLAKRTTSVQRIPPPTTEDRRHKYGLYRSRPTALDISPDGRQAVVLTYKHAYLFKRPNRGSWLAAFSEKPLTIPLPLPENFPDLRQREAICFTPDGNSLIVTSEGRGAGIYVLNHR